jgi:pilus assembly protein CpaB
MSIRTVLVIALALVFGGSAVMGLANLRSQSPPGDTVGVLVTTTDVPPFGVITADLVKVQDCPKELVPPGALTRIEDALDRSAITPLVKGEILLDGKLAPRGAGRGMAAKIPKGMRAYTIHTPTIQAGVSGFILPGNNVDVLLTLGGNGDNDPKGSGTVTLLQNVPILAVEQRVEAPAESKVDPNQLKSVTLLVTPQAAAKLNLAHARGKLHLSLRNLNDKEDIATKPVFARELWGEHQETPPPKAEKVVPPVRKTAPKPPEIIRTLRGTQEGAVRVVPVDG